MSWERVYTVNGFWDWPRLGVADFKGRPHIYESDFSDIGSVREDKFRLMPIESDLFALVQEDQAIWLRWLAAWRRGTTTKETHPALPEDRLRHNALQDAIGDRLHARPESSILRSARFRADIDDRWEVEWKEPDLSGH